MTQSPQPAAQFFNQEMAEAYDRRNAGLKPISDNLHFLMGLALKDLPTDAHVLCVGVGTGAEILSLARAYPGWSFVGIDPSGEMLGVGRHRLAEAGVLDRCELVEGYVGTRLAARASTPSSACWWRISSSARIGPPSMRRFVPG